MILNGLYFNGSLWSEKRIEGDCLRYMFNKVKHLMIENAEINATGSEAMG